MLHASFDGPNYASGSDAIGRDTATAQARPRAMPNIPAGAPKMMAGARHFACNVYTVDIMDTIGPFEQAVLVALVRLREDAYGRAILNEVKERLDREVSAGAVYATLERLETKGLASSKLAAGTAIRGGRARRYFSVTGAGVRALNDAKTATDMLWHGLTWPLKVRT